MDLLRAGEALMRHSQPLLPLLNSNACRSSTRICSKATIRWTHQTSHSRASYSHASGSRRFSLSTRLRQDELAAKPLSNQEQVPQPGPSSRVADELNDVLNSTRDLRSQPPNNALSTETSDFSETNSGKSSLGGSGSAHRHSNTLIDMGDDFWDLFGVPKGKTGLTRPTAQPEKSLPFKLNASVGRTVRIDDNRGMDVGRAFRQLDIMCARNRVKRDAARQRFHERPGLKRKRLKSERWRRRFKEGFKALVQKAMAMKKQGW